MVPPEQVVAAQKMKMPLVRHPNPVHLLCVAGKLSVDLRIAQLVELASTLKNHPTSPPHPYGHRKANEHEVYNYC